MTGPGWLLYPFASLQSLIETRREGEEEEAMDTLRIFVLFCVSGGWLDARCSGGDFKSLFYAVFVERWSWKDCGVVGSASIVELYPVHTLPKKSRLSL